MKSQTHNPTDEATETRLIDTTELFDAFAVQRRQYALAYLIHHPSPVPITDLAVFIARQERDAATRPYSTDDQYERVLVDLCHVHLPKLADIGLLQYDTNTELVELLVDSQILVPYLELTDIDHLAIDVSVDSDTDTDTDAPPSA
ncbi:hypothetical protein C482_17463 [Natrialba chahannaoensis JCM 10990]|uniref:DUF7344 domain-containing protein n=1 Tax=Natrialba chahannaoensis JCM 10990 TaxID=1227492 RepID=M0A937_9EURY|nr:hypothetical protein [Natrialba chahannaoensis]ELY94886.1 hypothetical protein C482_17463 [Natrialba chahannaoensis JCM 10990]